MQVSCEILNLESFILFARYIVLPSITSRCLSNPISLLDPAMSRSSFPIRTAETLDQGGRFPSTVSRCYREISLFLLTAVCSKQYRGQRCRLSSFLDASFVNVSSYPRDRSATRRWNSLDPLRLLEFPFRCSIPANKDYYSNSVIAKLVIPLRIGIISTKAS